MHVSLCLVPVASIARKRNTTNTTLIWYLMVLQLYVMPYNYV